MDVQDHEPALPLVSVLLYGVAATGIWSALMAGML